MNAAIIIIFGIAWFIFAYFWYGNIIKTKLIKSDDKTTTPSHEINDGKDYVPTKSPILFGHHFSSIAGAGPIVGPILAFAWFGWLPALIWILIGSVFMGAVHDYTALMASVRNKGTSIVEISEKAVSPLARNIFGIFVWLALILVQAVFASLTAKTLAQQPAIVLPTFGVIFIALIFGYMVNRKGLHIVPATIVSLVIMALSIYFDNIFTIQLSENQWLIITFIYAFTASILPVWILLQPRDYLSMYLLLFGLVIGFTGMIILHPTVNAPAYVSFNSAQGPLFPILFITVACGAISGFHSIVSSGTSAKQLNLESDGKKIAYGGMLVEGFLALLVIMMISSLLNWDAKAGSMFNFSEIFQSKTATGVFGAAFGRAAESIGIPITAGIAIGTLMLNAFILTTLDTTTRLNRYIMQETIGSKIGGIFKDKYFASASSVVIAFLLCYAGGYQTLWHLFGAANQLIGTLALFVISAYFLGLKRPKWYTLIPAVLMLFITESALAYKIFWQFVPQKEWLLLSMALLLFVLGIIVAAETYRKMRQAGKIANESLEPVVAE